jgi:hypothetical protein
MTTTTTTAPMPISEARAILERHGFRLYSWARSYRVTRDLPPYSQRVGQWFHRDERGFSASEVSLGWVRKLAQAVADSEAQRVTSCCCADAWVADRRAEIAWQEAGAAHRDANGWRRPDCTLEQVFDLGVAELKAAGASKVAQLVRQVLVESWVAAHPVPKYKTAAAAG